MTPEEQINDIVKKSGLVFSYQITFPKYNELPDEVQLAVKVLRNHGMVITFALAPDQKQNP